jgi:hypothetical protein
MAQEGLLKPICEYDQQVERWLALANQNPDNKRL